MLNLEDYILHAYEDEFDRDIIPDMHGVAFFISYEQFRDFCQTDDNFLLLWNNYVASRFNPDKAPKLTRINSRYILDSYKWVTNEQLCSNGRCPCES